jgi:hypothetical protein
MALPSTVTVRAASHMKEEARLIEVKNRLLRWLEGLRFPTLLLVAALLLLVDLIVPDVVPFVDEILLALATVVLARIKRRPAGEEPAGPRQEG